MGELDAHVQRRVAGDDAAHQHVAAAAGVFGQGLRGNVHAKRGHHARQQVKGIKSNARTPGVVQRRADAARLAQPHHARHIGELQGHGTGGLQPHQARFVAQFRFQIGQIHGVVELVGDAPSLQLCFDQRFIGLVDVLRQQDLVASAQHGERYQRQGRQTAGRQHTLQAALEGAQTLLQRVAAGRAVQAVGVRGFVFPFAAAHGRHIGEKDRRRFEDAGLRRIKTLRRPVGVVNQGGWSLGGHGAPRARRSTCESAAPGASRRSSQRAGGSRGWWAKIPPSNRG